MLFNSELVECPADNLKLLVFWIVFNTPQLIILPLLLDSQLVNQASSFIDHIRKLHLITKLIEQVSLKGSERSLHFVDEFGVHSFQRDKFDLALPHWDNLTISLELCRINDFEELFKTRFIKQKIQVERIGTLPINSLSNYHRSY